MDGKLRRSIRQMPGDECKQHNNETAKVTYVIFADTFYPYKIDLTHGCKNGILIYEK